MRAGESLAAGAALLFVLAMHLIHQPLAAANSALPRIKLPVERWQLQKRRWRATASDATEFGFELEQPLTHQAVFFQSPTHVYVIEQQAEALLEAPLPEASTEIAHLAWQIGNLHFPLELLPKSLRVADDPALRQMLEQLHVHYHEARAVFQPLKGAAHHHH